ncbi:uncharacterized protein LOC117178622 [Belonocnema kinseyi]|uniref:uncharacterized protein LOC117178622 n=1 Tax=Belonocnema kinseyi TaxID=2817044 RepID=UPI00143D6EB9|nr:uncharacterized protein LOC117178622 [Belonocnema kinseyi]
MGLTGIKQEIGKNDIFERYSYIPKLQRIVAYLCRYVHNLRNKNNKIIGNLTEAEVHKSIQLIIQLTQSAKFSKEACYLKRDQKMDNHTRLIPLNPFLDSQNILKVGGRLAYSELPVGQKHPILLPSNHCITRLIFREEHLRLNHSGAQATLYSVREKYWTLDSRHLTRKIIHQWIRCFRVKPRGADYIMGNLPQERVSVSRPFLNVGVDFYDLFYIKKKAHQNRKRIKSYVAVYTCTATKAVHLELVSSLTTEAFIGSLNRFFSRRGNSKSIHSDNVKNSLELVVSSRIFMNCLNRPSILK